MIWALIGLAIVGGLLLALALLRNRQTEPQRDTLPSPMLDTSLPELDLTDVAQEEPSAVRWKP